MAKDKIQLIESQYCFFTEKYVNFLLHEIVRIFAFSILSFFISDKTLGGKSATFEK